MPRGIAISPGFLGIFFPNQKYWYRRSYWETDNIGVTNHSKLAEFEKISQVEDRA